MKVPIQQPNAYDHDDYNVRGKFQFRQKIIVGVSIKQGYEFLLPGAEGGRAIAPIIGLGDCGSVSAGNPPLPSVICP